MYETSEVLVGLWEAFVVSHNWLIEFLPKPWVAIGDALNGGPANWLWITLLCLAMVYASSTAVEEVGKHGKPLFRKVARVITYTATGPPVLLASITASLQFIAGLYLYVLWIVVAVYALIIAIFAYPTEWMIRLF